MNVKKIIPILVMLLVLLNITGCRDKKNIQSEDALKFKEEYESINDTSNSSGKKHRVLSISKDNPFIYATGEEIVKKMEKNETFYVYFGSSYCPWCRSVIEKAIEVAKKNNIDTIYYVDIWEGDHVEVLRDTYELNDDGNPQLVSEGGPGYKNLLNYFDDILEDYTLTDKDGNKVSVGEKRIFAPTFIYVEKGESISLTTGISEKQSDARGELSNEILKEEETQFNKFFQK